MSASPAEIRIAEGQVWWQRGGFGRGDRPRCWVLAPCTPGTWWVSLTGPDVGATPWGEEELAKWIRENRLQLEAPR